MKDIPYPKNAARWYLQTWFKDKGESFKTLLRLVLKGWMLQNVRSDDAGNYLVRIGRGLLGRNFEATDKDIDEFEPWQVHPSYPISDNLSLFSHLFKKGELEFGGLNTEIHQIAIWAAAILEFDGSASSTVEAYDNFCLALIAAYHKEIKTSLENLKVVVTSAADLRRRLSKIGRQPNHKKLSMLKDRIAALRGKNPKLTRGKVAEMLSEESEIDLGETQIKKYISKWYTPEAWPLSAGGRPKTRH